MATDFIARLHESAHWEAYVAAAFTREGFYVRLSPSKVGPEYQGNIDLQVALEPDGPWEDVEVKGTRPMIAEGRVLVCAEKPFLKHVPDWPLNPGPYKLYAWWVYCNPKTGDVQCLPKDIDVITGHMQWDRTRNDIYPCIQASSWRLISLKECCERLKEALRRRADCGYVHRQDYPGGEVQPGGGSGGCPGGTETPGATKPKRRAKGRRKPVAVQGFSSGRVSHSRLQADQGKGQTLVYPRTDDNKAGG